MIQEGKNTNKYDDPSHFMSDNFFFVTDLFIFIIYLLLFLSI